MVVLAGRVVTVSERPNGCGHGQYSRAEKTRSEKSSKTETNPCYPVHAAKNPERAVLGKVSTLYKRNDIIYTIVAQRLALCPAHREAAVSAEYWWAGLRSIPALVRDGTTPL